jgi:hypothetical protein
MKIFILYIKILLGKCCEIYDLDQLGIAFHMLLSQRVVQVHQMMGEGSVASTRVVRGELVEKEHPGYRSYSQAGCANIPTQ